VRHEGALLQQPGQLNGTSFQQQHRSILPLLTFACSLVMRCLLN
jgi:hypothetical protein